jgi:preprotein translocase subunit SecG
MKISPDAIFAIFLGLIACLLFSGLTTGHNWGDDFAAYIMQAGSILHQTPQQFYEANQFTVESSTRAMGPVAYPWGYPILLVPIYAIFGLNLIAIKSMTVMLYLCFLSALWFGFRRYHSDLYRIFLICLFAFNPTLTEFLNNILSDIPFLLFSTLAVILIGLVIVKSQQLTSRAGDHLLVGASIAAAFLIRTNGILLLATLAIAQLVTMREKSFQLKDDKLRVFGFHFLPYASFAAIILVCGIFLPEGGASHLSHLKQFSPGMAKHLLHYYIDLPATFFAGVRHNLLLFGATIPLAVAGMIKRRHSDHHMIAYIGLTFVLYILWPGTQGIRFLFPILPFYFSFVLSTLEECGEDTRGKEWILWKTTSIFAVIIVLLSFGMESTSSAIKNLDQNRQSLSGPFVETSQAMFTFIAENTDPESTVIFFKPRAMRLMTDRRSLMIDKVDQLSRGDFLCIYLRGDASDQIFPNEARPLIEQRKIELIYSNEDFEVYRIIDASKKTDNPGMSYANQIL